MGAIGGAMAPRWTYLDPQVFNPLVSFQTVIMALLGAGHRRGPGPGRRIPRPPSEILLVKFRYLYMLSLGLVLIVVVLVLPRGLAGLGAPAPGLRLPEPDAIVAVGSAPCHVGPSSTTRRSPPSSARIRGASPPSSSRSVD